MRKRQLRDRLLQNYHKIYKSFKGLTAVGICDAQPRYRLCVYFDISKLQYFLYRAIIKQSRTIV